MTNTEPSLLAVLVDDLTADGFSVDDGLPAGSEGRDRVATSSASRPAIVASMLDASRVELGMRVLEIGTGTGYTAALLTQRLGVRNVTSIEI